MITSQKSNLDLYVVRIISLCHEPVGKSVPSTGTTVLKRPQPDFKGSGTPYSKKAFNNLSQSLLFIGS